MTRYNNILSCIYISDNNCLQTEMGKNIEYPSAFITVWGCSEEDICVVERCAFLSRSFGLIKCHAFVLFSGVHAPFPGQHSQGDSCENISTVGINEKSYAIKQ